MKENKSEKKNYNLTHTYQVVTTSYMFSHVGVSPKVMFDYEETHYGIHVQKIIIEIFIIIETYIDLQFSSGIFKHE